MAYGTNAPFGLRPLQSINGGSWTEKTNEYNLYASADGATTYDTSLFTGDPVIWNPKPKAAGGTLAAYPTTAAAGDAPVMGILGIFMGCEYFDALNRLTKSSFWPGKTPIYPGTRIKAWVIDDPTVIYDVQVSTSTTTVADAYFTPQMLGQNFTFNVAQGGDPVFNPAIGSALSGQSVYYLDVKTKLPNPTTTLSAKVLGYTLNPQNIPVPGKTLADSPFLNVRVLINNHTFKPGTPGVVAAD